MFVLQSNLHLVSSYLLNAQLGEYGLTLYPFIKHFPHFRSFSFKYLTCFFSIKFDMVLKICYRVLPMTLCLYHVTRAIRIDMSETNLSVVPEDIRSDVTHLILDRNNIIRITNTSLALYQELSYLHIWRSSLTYIEDGSFDHNPKLKTLSAGKNQIMQLPHSFGAATTSLNTIHFWCSLRDPAIHNMNFTEMISLEWLNVGCGNHHGRFDAAVLPSNLKYICLNSGRLTEFPYFAR